MQSVLMVHMNTCWIISSPGWKGHPQKASIGYLVLQAQERPPLHIPLLTALSWPHLRTQSSLEVISFLHGNLKRQDLPPTSFIQSCTISPLDARLSPMLWLIWGSPIPLTRTSALSWMGCLSDLGRHLNQQGSQSCWHHSHSTSSSLTLLTRLMELEGPSCCVTFWMSSMKTT